MYFYTSNSEEAPKLNNTAGDFNRVLNYILDGGETYNITKIENNSQNKQNTIRLYYADDVCKFIKYQTIDITGSIIDEYNNSFFIESINTVSKYIVCHRSNITENLSDDSTADIKMKIHNAGFTRKFGGIEDNITVIEFANGIEYRFDDRDMRELFTPPVTPDTSNDNWFKLVRVAMSSSFDSLYSSEGRVYPTINEEPDQIFNVVNNKFCNAYINYNKISTEYYYTDANPAHANTPYKIFANEKCMYIVLSNLNNPKLKYVYAFGMFDDLNPENVNGFMFCLGYSGGAYTDYSQFTSGTYPYNDTTNLLAVYETTDMNYYNKFIHSVIYNNSNNEYAPITRSSELFLSPEISGHIRGRYISYTNKVNNGIYFSDVVLSSTLLNDKTFYGKLFDVKWACTNLSSIGTQDGNIYEIDNDIYYEYVHACAGSETYLSKNYIKLTRN